MVKRKFPSCRAPENCCCEIAERAISSRATGYLLWSLRLANDETVAGIAHDFTTYARILEQEIFEWCGTPGGRLTARYTRRVRELGWNIRHRSPAAGVLPEPKSFAYMNSDTLGTSTPLYVLLLV